MKKLLSVLSNTSRSLAPPIYSILLSLLVIQFSDRTVWGHFVADLIIISLLAQVLNWGHKEFLLRSFSQSPSEIPRLFIENFLGRSVLLPIAFIFLIFYAGSFVMACWLAGWLLSLHCYQSLEVFVIYKKHFLKQLAAETLGFVTTMTGLLLQPIDPEQLIQWYTIGIMVKFTVLLISMKSEIKWNFPIKPDWSYFKTGLPFFMIGLSGMLQSKIDLYVVGLVSDAESLGTYQVVVNLFIYLQATAGFILTPFTRHLYRINAFSFQKLKKKFLQLGLLICLASLPFIYVVLEYLYGIQVENTIYLFGFLLASPIFIYLPYIYDWYRSGLEKKVMVINFVATGISGLLTFILLGIMDIKGALLAAAFTQWLIAGSYYWLRIKN